ncbi:MAG: glycosyltransferase family 4 protein [Ignavibacteria bacterium]
MILYAGNKLSKFGLTPTFIETLTPELSGHYDLISVSDKKNKFLRLSDMVFNVYKNRKRLKLVLIDSYSMQAFWYTYILAKISLMNNIPYMPILRGGGYPERLKSSPKLCRSVFSRSAKNISPSLYLKKHFEDSGYEVVYIPNFIPIEKYSYKQRENVRPKLLWVRSFHEIYNPLLALEVLKKLKNKFSDAELCMVGPDKDGTLQKVIDKAKEDKLSDSLRITMKLSKSEWLELSTGYDIFINTTDFDNHPVSVIEAMATGLPVISTNVGGLPFLIENNIDGILVNPRSPDEFADQVERLISDNDLVKKITLNARKKAEGFDWGIIKNKWFAVIDQVIKNQNVL